MKFNAGVYCKYRENFCSYQARIIFALQEVEVQPYGFSQKTLILKNLH
jgi:hypothetical protein